MLDSERGEHSKPLLSGQQPADAARRPLVLPRRRLPARSTDDSEGRGPAVVQVVGPGLVVCLADTDAGASSLRRTGVEYRMGFAVKSLIPVRSWCRTSRYAGVRTAWATASSSATTSAARGVASVSVLCVCARRDGHGDGRDRRGRRARRRARVGVGCCSPTSCCCSRCSRAGTRRPSASRCVRALRALLFVLMVMAIDDGARDGRGRWAGSTRSRGWWYLLAANIGQSSRRS